MIRYAIIFVTLCLIQIGCTTTVKIGPDGKPLPNLYRINVVDSIKIQFRVLDSINSIRTASGEKSLKLETRKDIYLLFCYNIKSQVTYAP